MQQSAKKDHIDSSNCDSAEPTSRLMRAMSLAFELEELLQPSGWPDSHLFRLRLARAHALSAIDSLTDLILQQPQSTQSGVYAVDRDDLPLV